MTVMTTRHAGDIGTVAREAGLDDAQTRAFRSSAVPSAVERSEAYSRSAAECIEGRVRWQPRD